MTRKTVFISVWRPVSIRYIMYSDIFKRLREPGTLDFVIFVRDGNVDYYSKKFLGDDITVEPVLFNETLKLLRFNIISVFFNSVRRGVSGSRAGFKNTTLTARLYHLGLQFNRNWKDRAFFFCVKVCAYLGNTLPCFRKALLSLESWLFPGKMYDKYFEKYKPDMLITSSLGHMIDSYFMRAAKRYGCRSVSIIHSWDNTSGKGYRGA